MYIDATQDLAFGESPVLTVEMLSELPAELLDELRHAILVLDREVPISLIERIKVHATVTAKGLQILVDGFQFERIRDLLRDLK